MKIKSLAIICLFLLSLSFASCRTNRNVSGAVTAMSMETVSLGSAGDGTITLRTWGAGRNRGEAIEQAKRNALHDVIFKGIKKGPNIGLASKPLVPEVNAEEKYAVYFEPFFSPGGEYKNFVVEEPGSAERLTSQGVSRESYGIIVIVDRDALKQQLLQDGVLKN